MTPPRILQLLATPLVAAALSGCNDDAPMVSLGIDDTYYVERLTKLPLESAFTGHGYRWTLLDGPGCAEPSVVSTGSGYVFMAREEGAYRLSFEVIDDDTPYRHEFTVHVLHEEVEFSPYIARVYEYCPAPGQFVNEMPRYETGDTYADIIQKAEDCISGTNDIMITLGGYGGYVTFGFDHTVANVPGEPDFRIWGNCFYEAVNPEDKGGSAEPGIVQVSYDVNCNGIPDDPWYELRGSDHSNPQTLHNYTIRYHRPDPSHTPVEDESGFLDDIMYIPWDDSEGIYSYMPKNIFHNQSYWPLWLDDDTITFTGTCLPPNGIDRSGTGRYFVLYSYPWGYVDNHPNDYAHLNSFDIGNAVDLRGNPVHLPGADFIRVYTGVNQYCGWLGETSTELSRAQDLHISLY